MVEWVKDPAAQVTAVARIWFLARNFYKPRGRQNKKQTPKLLLKEECQKLAQLYFLLPQWTNEAHLITAEHWAHPERPERTGDGLNYHYLLLHIVF